MLTRLYIEALLVNKELADQIWEAWDKGEIDDQVAWWMITLNVKQFEKFVLRLGDNNKKAKPTKRWGGRPLVLASFATP